MSAQGAGDYYNWPKNLWSSNSYILTADTASTITGASSTGWGGTVFNYTTPYLTQKVRITKAQLEDFVVTTQEELARINQRFRIFDSQYSFCEVLASKMFFSLLPKGSAELALSAPLSNLSAWPDGRRNTFLLVTSDEHEVNPETLDMTAIVYVVDICAAQHGGTIIQQQSVALQTPWKAEIVYKGFTSLLKRLHKEGHHPAKDLSVKDAIALSTKYGVTDSNPTQLDIHQINPKDVAGVKFLEKFSKEVGFKTHLAQLLLDPDPVVAEKAYAIAQILLAR